MNTKLIIETQLKFYKSGKAGCLFAAHAANNPEKYGWRSSVCLLDAKQIIFCIKEAIDLPGISTQSIIFPQIFTDEDFLCLLRLLDVVPAISIGQEEKIKNKICVGYRISLNRGIRSWVSGFGNFSFLPTTRQSVFTELIFRSKSRPKYKKVMKHSSKDIVHIADMYMVGMNENKFKTLWYGSLDNTENIIGHKPDIESAARTTFSIPFNLWNQK